MTVSTILFDAYGTLLSTGNASVDATHMILKKHDRTDLDAIAFYDEWKRLRAETIKNMTEFVCEAEVFRSTLRALYQKYGIDGNADDDVQIMLDTWGTRDAFPEVRQIVHCLSQTHILCIASTTDTAPLLRDLDRNGLNISRIYTSESMRVYKPHRAFYETILDDLRLTPDRVLFVGDSLTDDVWGPTQLCIKTCHVNRKNTPYRDIIPDYTVSTLKELPDLLRGKQL